MHADHLGTAQTVTGAGGVVVWDASYRPFGEVTVTGTASFNQRFSGQYADAETGYHDNWNRTYDPSIGRYLQSDPIGLAGGLNTYGYVDGNPVIFIDRTGEYGAAGTVYGIISGATGGYYSTGSIGGGIVGGVVGGIIGFAAPSASSYAGTAAAGFVSSIGGQILGQYYDNPCDDIQIDYGLAFASAIGGVGARGFNSHLNNPRRNAFVYEQYVKYGPNPSPPWLNSIVEGGIGGLTEAAYSAFDNWLQGT